ncbi:MAG: photosystem II stability/assembly factor-like protein [Cyclobacteriaceae bacterium]|nr:photosystem II stability/assembly factor-like protein [Cyclobacteriaceae bacterium]
MKAFTTLLVFSLVATHVFAQTLSIKNCEIDIKSSFRGLSVVNDSVVWVSGSAGWVGRSLNGATTWSFKQVAGFEKVDFRSLYAFDSQTAIIANAGSPASILLTTNGGETWKSVYTNTHKDAFFDGVDFWDKKQGVIYGDPIDGRMLLVKTIDGGKTWQEFPDAQRPLLEEGEASFAASGTGIRCYDKSLLMISTGGKVSRLYSTTNFGKKWTVQSPPVIQGESSTGIFSFAFRNNSGILVGGDYLKDSLRVQHIVLTKNAGKDWNAPTTPTRGYRECVEYISDQIVISTGPSGTDVSHNGGMDWSFISDEKGFHVVRKARTGKLIVIAGNAKIGKIE